MRTSTILPPLQEAKPTTLIVVFPGLSMLPRAMMECISGFDGQRIILIDGACPEASGMPLPLHAHLRGWENSGRLRRLSSAMFGNRNGLTQPIALVLEIVKHAGLAPESDSLLMTGCYRGEVPGSVDVLAEACAALHFHVTIDSGLPRR